MQAQNIRPAAVAGTFYPQDPQELRSMVQSFLAKAPLAAEGEPPAFVSPHAGFIYSGQVAAYGYKNLKKAPIERPRRVFVLAPSHRVYLDGVSVGNYSAYQTPLGDITLDQETIEKLLKLPDVTNNPASHKMDHALEVQLPFLQETVVNFRLVPIMFGDISGGQLADIVATCWQQEDLIIVSSDLSHFHPYQQAQKLDQNSHDAVLSQQPREIESCEACGRTGIAALLEMARRQKWQPSLSKYCNSGDTAGDKNSVVGYATYLFHPNQSTPARTTPATTTADLPRLVRSHLEKVLGGTKGLEATTLIKQFPDLAQQGATFITLTKNGQLRGCIGSLVAHRSLAEDLLENSISAATRDPRFAAVTREELADLRVEVSRLTEATPLLYHDGEDLLTRLKPGIHGVILEKNGHRSTFLPQVWEQLPNPVQFLEHLCQKAGLQGDCWKNNPNISTYTVEKTKETG
ncbi:MAG: AmmeMemoRadiSam system protein B [Magnetococcales bacterium]|nr:AmmeMemoRadiSam system protein B [Magnetococcales bacterium]